MAKLRIQSCCYGWMLAITILGWSTPQVRADDLSDFEDRVIQLLAYEDAINRYCVRTEVELADHPANKVASSEKKTVFMAVDKAKNMIRMDAAGELLEETGREGSYFFRYLRRGKVNSLGYIGAGGFESATSEDSLVSHIGQKIVSPFSLPFNGYAKEQPSHFWEFGFFRYGDYFAPERIMHAERIPGGMRGTVLTYSKRMLMEMFFSDDPNVFLPKITIYPFMDQIDPKNPRNDCKPWTTINTKWIRRGDEMVPSEVSLTWRIGIPPNFDRTDYVYKLKWFNGEVPDSVFEEKETKIGPDGKTALERLFK